MRGSQRTNQVPSTNHVAFLHLRNVLATEAARFPAGNTVRILDAGCGDCRLIAYLNETLPLVTPGRDYEFYGFDLQDFWPIENFGHAMSRLELSHPETPWDSRISRIGAESPWPYSDGSFDIIISNQVGEHVQDHDRFFCEVSRCLHPTGFSVHLFPLKHVLMEWHVLMPLAHRIGNFDLLRSMMTLYGRLGGGVFRDHRNRAELDKLTAGHAEYVIRFTNYITYGDLMKITKKCGLLVSTRYTKDFYAQKLRRVLGRPEAHRYRRDRYPLQEWLSFMALRYVQGVTIFLEKGGHFERINTQKGKTDTDDRTSW